MSNGSNGTWTDYVTGVLAGESQSAASRRTGVDQTTLSRWLAGRGLNRLSPKKVRAFARGYGQPVLEAYVEAGLLEPEDVSGDEDAAHFEREYEHCCAENERLRAGIEALRTEMVGLIGAGASIVGRQWIVRKCDALLEGSQA